ncbi:MAG: hypothetical protein PHW52_00415 [Candidatus Pacebacteria bacterium]|nr:hypothetical protein [Candidatus Paceibacterota bacterium]
MNNSAKIILLAGGVLFIFIVIIVFSGAQKGTSVVEDQTKKGFVSNMENKADVFNDYNVEEWNNFRFKYKDDWKVEKKYNNNQLESLIVRKDDNQDNYIFIGGKDDCGDMTNQRCVMAGYGMIIEPIYTNSKDETSLSVLDKLVKSIIDFRGENRFDSKLLKDDIFNFLNAKINNDNTQIRKYVSPSFLESQTFHYITSGESRWSRYETSGDIDFLDENTYKIKVVVHEYYDSKEKDIGNRELLFTVVNNSGNYLISDIEIGKFNQSN